MFHQGREPLEIVFSCHVCHPSLCNDNLSGIAVAALLAEQLAGHSAGHPGRAPLRYSYRFLFLPGTISPLAWLSRNEKSLSRIRHGLVLAGVGDAGGFTYKRSRRGDEIDGTMLRALKDSGEPYTVVDFSPVGYDERQYCSPGISLPVGCLMRTPHGCYPEYHTSADNLDLVKAGPLPGLSPSAPPFCRCWRGTANTKTSLPGASRSWEGGGSTPAARGRKGRRSSPSMGAESLGRCLFPPGSRGDQFLRPQGRPWRPGGTNGAGASSRMSPGHRRAGDRQGGCPLPR
ncbi:MAG: DUF4910 domain-containing protein [Thermodesulfovibrionales bacterium]